MDLRYDIIIGGMGGQGIILAGLILGTAATVYAGKNAVQIQSYGPEARGGRVRSEIAISDEEIDCPKAEYVDIGVFMSQLSYQTYSWRVKSKGIIVTFFVLMISFSNLDEVKFAMAANSLKGALGVMRRYPSVRNNLGIDNNVREQQGVYDSVREIEKKAQELGIENDLNNKFTKI